MAKIIDSSFKNWNDGETITAAEYKMEHDIIKMAVNDNDDRIAILENAAGGAIRRIPSGTSFPSSPQVGDVFFRTDQGLLYVLNASSQWDIQSVKEHAARTDNPHEVTAAQLSVYTKQESDASFSKNIGAVSGNGAGFSLNAGFQIIPLVPYVKEINANIFSQGASAHNIGFKKSGLYLVNLSMTRSDLVANQYWEIGFAINDKQETMITQKMHTGKYDWALDGGPNQTRVPLSLTHTVRVNANDYINFNTNSQDGPRSYENIKFSVVRISD